MTNRTQNRVLFSLFCPTRNTTHYMYVEYKKLVEARLMNHAGTSLEEVVAVTLAGVAACALSARVAATAWSTARRASPSSAMCGRGLEFVGVVLPLLLLASAPSAAATFHYAAAIALVAALVVALSGRRRVDPAAPPAASAAQGDAALSVLRGSLMLQTMVAILAVDFQIFPLRFMKCESFGVSLMDLGVGAFVFSAAATTAAASSSSSSAARAVAADPRRPATTVAARLRAALRSLGSSAPLFALGGARMASVAAAGYQEHVSEYGTHWNFFLTLGFLPLVVGAYNRVIAAACAVLGRDGSSSNDKDRGGTDDGDAATASSGGGLAAGCLLLLLHQVLLSRGGVTEFVMSPHRRSLLEGNKEGIVSSLGYAALYMIARAGHAWVARGAGSGDGAVAMRRSTAAGVYCLAVGYVLHVAAQETSRRLCNAAYVLLCLGIGFVAYALCRALVGRGGSSSSSSSSSSSVSIVESISANQLPLFLLANVATGLVNLSMRTIFASPLVAHAVLAAYLAVIAVVAWQLATRRIKLKVW